MKTSNLAAAILCFGLAGCAATAPKVSPTAKAELAPQGRMRVAIFADNPLHVTQGRPAGEEMKGLVPDMGRALAKQLGAEFHPVRYATPATLLEGAVKGEWDVAFVGYSPERASVMDFTPVVFNGENSYLVRGDSPIRSAADVDREGVRVATLPRTAQDVFLRKNLRRATIVSVPGNSTGVQELTAGRVDVFAANRHSLVEASAGVPGSRVLEGSFLQLPYVIAVQKGRPAGLAYASEFVQFFQQSGALEDAIKRANVYGVTVPR